MRQSDREYEQEVTEQEEQRSSNIYPVSVSEGENEGKVHYSRKEWLTLFQSERRKSSRSRSPTNHTRIFFF